MTNKLKRKCKKVAITFVTGTLSIVSLGAISAKLSVMQENKIKTLTTTNTLVQTSQAETIVTQIGIPVENNTYIEAIANPVTQASISTANVASIASDGAIICESLVQGARENDLADGNYTFRVTRKQRNIK